MHKNSAIIVSVVSVVILALLTLGVLWNQRTGSNGNLSPSPAAFNGAVPDSATSTAALNVARPAEVAEAAPGVESKLRVFNIAVSRGKFVPDTIAVHTGDTVQITFSADDSYVIAQPAYGLKLSLQKETSRFLEFAATSAGRTAFVCESCGQTEAGYLLVVER